MVTYGARRGVRCGGSGAWPKPSSVERRPARDDDIGRSLRCGKKRTAAATVLASYESRFTGIKSHLNDLECMIGFHLAISVSIGFKLFS